MSICDSCKGKLFLETEFCFEMKLGQYFKRIKNPVNSSRDVFLISVLEQNVKIKKIVCQNLQIRKDRFMTIFGHIFANYIKILNKTEVQTVLFWCFKG